MATTGNIVVTLVPMPVVPSTEESTSKQRWSRNKFVRAIHIICSEDLKSLFINRDRKLDRQEMDAKGKDAFWEKVAIVFNSNKHFDIDRQKGNKSFKTLSAAPVPYITDAAHKLAGYITFVCNSVVPLHWQELQQRGRALCVMLRPPLPPPSRPPPATRRRHDHRQQPARRSRPMLQQLPQLQLLPTPMPSLKPQRRLRLLHSPK